jgi:hypothetical protein
MALNTFFDFITFFQVFARLIILIVVAFPTADFVYLGVILFVIQLMLSVIKIDGTFLIFDIRFRVQLDNIRYRGGGINPGREKHERDGNQNCGE